jgi:hypothetical protein
MNIEELILIKAGMAEALEKRGSSLTEMEGFLSKHADWGEKLFDLGAKGIGRLTGGIASLGGYAAEHAPELAGGAMLLGGVTAGGLAYGANKSITDEDKHIAGRQAEVDRYRQLTGRIKSDYGIQ